MKLELKVRKSGLPGLSSRRARGLIEGCGGRINRGLLDLELYPKAAIAHVVGFAIDVRSHISILLGPLLYGHRHFDSHTKLRRARLFRAVDHEGVGKPRRQLFTLVLGEDQLHPQRCQYESRLGLALRRRSETGGGY